MQLTSEKAVCSHCGERQFYDVVLSCNSFTNWFPSNKCHKCGTQLTEDAIDLDTCSALYYSMYEFKKVGELLRSRYPEDYSMPACELCGNKNISQSWTILWHDEKVRIAGEEYANDDSIVFEKCEYECKDCGKTWVATFDDYKDKYDLVCYANDGYMLLRKNDKYEEMNASSTSKRVERYLDVKSELIKMGVLSKR